MTADDDRSAENHRGTRDRPARTARRRRIVSGVAGLAAALGSGAYLVTDTFVDDDRAAPRTEVRQAQPLTAGSDGDATSTVTDRLTSADPPGNAPGSAAGRTQDPPNDTGDDQVKTPEERVKAARKAAAENGVKLMHPVEPEKKVPAADVESTVKVRNTGSLREGGTLRVITAHGDLTGQRELAWVAGRVTEHGAVKCTQTIKLANEAKPQKRDTLLLCWRTSPRRSVVTVAVDMDGTPSKAESAAVIAREWRKLS
jgi:hypothetical protein